MNSPKLWRELHRSNEGDDVEAAQRCLWQLLGDDSTNARNGTYGEETAHDVERARRLLDIPGDVNTIGATLWTPLYTCIDPFGETLFANQPVQTPSPTPTAKRLPLKIGMTGADVQACQRALWRALQGKATNGRTGNYGNETMQDVMRFRERYDVNPSDPGTKIGGDLYAVLTRWFDQAAVDLMHAYKPPKPPPAGNIMERALNTAISEVGYQEGAGNHSRYGEWYGMNYQAWCAMFVTWCAEQHGSESHVKGSRYAYCPYVVDDARAGRNGLTHVSPGEVRRGGLVLFDWAGDGVADHIGFVDDPPGGGSSFTTVEGNTSAGSSGSQSNGDGVYRRTRYVSDVVLFAHWS